jgi:hypothetical protein
MGQAKGQPGVVHERTRPSTRSEWVTASSWATIPPWLAPSTWALRMPAASISPTMSATANQPAGRWRLAERLSGA